MKFLHKRQKAFTLTELIIVIAIIGILAAVLIPSITGYIERAKISKHEQNARNLSSVIIAEAILGDKEFLFPEEVTDLATAQGYDLISDVDGYAYWYDATTNRVIFCSIDEVGISASSFQGRARIENLSPSNPNYYYIDQTPNAIRTAIDQVNALVANAKTALGGTPTRIQILDKMDEIVSQVASGISDLDRDLNDNTIAQITSYIASFNTTDTIYYSDEGAFNKQLEANNNKTAGINVERATIINGTTAIVDNAEYHSIDITISSPIIIPATVNTFAEEAISNIVSGIVYVSSSSAINTATLAEKGVIVASLATLQQTHYTTINIDPNYNNKEYRFQNGIYVTIPVGSSLSILTCDTHDLFVVKTGEAYSFYRSKVNGSTYSYFATDGKYYDYATAQTAAEGTSPIANALLSEYLVPSIEVSQGIFNLAAFMEGESIIGNISIKSAAYPRATEYSAVLVDSSYNGYLINGIGNISDIYYELEQLRNDNGKMTIFENTSATLTIDLPDEAKDFKNYSNLEVYVDYQFEYVEFEEYGLPDGTFIDIPTGTKYYGETITNAQATGTNVDGFVLEVTGINTYLDSTLNQACNQIKIQKITIKSGDNILFVRYY